MEQAGLLELELDYSSLDHVVQTINVAKQFTEQVFLVLTPRNIEIVNTTPEGLERLKSSLSYISKNTGAEVIDFYSGNAGYEIDSFNDATHLNSDGAKYFSIQLAQLLYKKIIPAADAN